MLGLQVGSPLDRHRAAAVVVGSGDLALTKTKPLQDIQAGIVELLIGQAQPLPAEFFPKRPFVERKLDLERLVERALDLFEGLLVEPFGTQCLMIDERRALQGASPQAIGNDVLDLMIRIPETF